MPARRAGPRKVVVGTAMFNMFGPYPGLDARLTELAGLVDRMAEQAAALYPGRRLDLAALPETAVSGEAQGPVSKVAYPLEGKVLDVMGSAARRAGCYVVLPLYLTDDAGGSYSNAAVLLDREGRPAGVYRKVFAVVNRGSDLAEGGVTPGREFPVFACDFGTVGMQICWDMAFDEGWEALARKGAELVVWPSQWPGQIHPSARALRHGYYVLSSTWRNNASLTDPTGHTIRQIRGRDGVFVERIDLEYAVLTWQRTLQCGKAFDERYGARAGYRYSEAEDCGIFWSNDPATPIGEMLRELDLETKAEETARSRRVLDALRPQRPI
jgi:predicted amidohydrolase